MGWKNNSNFTSTEKEKLAKIDVGLKSNLNATSAPTVNDDVTKGYGAGSTWKYNNVTFVCGDAAEGKAEWAPSTEIYYFDTWAQLVAAISVTGTNYVNKYASVANANGGPVGGATYTAPNSLTNYIVDGGAAAYKILAQGTNYSVTCTPRTITNPVVKSVMVVPDAKPTTPGYYIFTVNPTDGLPVGIGLNDIAYYDGTTWSLYQLYVRATAVLVATNQTMTTQVTWRKFAGTWMSTADEYIPDNKEYQTGKLYNGKPVYRKCKSSTVTTDGNGNIPAIMTIPMTGKLLIIQAIAQRTDNYWFTISSPSTNLEFSVSPTGVVGGYTTTGAFANKSFTIWVEYTKN